MKHFLTDARANGRSRYKYGGSIAGCNVVEPCNCIGSNAETSDQCLAGLTQKGDLCRGKWKCENATKKGDLKESRGHIHWLVL